MRYLFCVLTVVLSSSCLYSSNLFRELPPSESKITWTHENGFSRNRYLPETIGSGVAIFDYNNDGRMDILLVNSGDAPFYHPKAPLHHALYRNNGDGTFTDVTRQAGITADIYATGVAVGDYDGDGYPDVFIAGYGKCVLYHNNGDGTFSDVTASSGIANPQWGTSALWFDYDNDGKLDLFVGEFADYSSLRSCKAAESYGGTGGNLPKEQAYYCNPNQFPPVASHLYRNLGNGRFEDVSKATGIGSAPGKAWAVVATDVNQDGYMDLFVANDTMADFLWINHEGKSFENVGLEAGVGYSADGLPRSGMGVDADDFDHDGRPDLVTTNIDMQNTSLYKNLGGEVFQELNIQTGLAKVTRMLSGWGIRLFDYDNDGWLDLVQVNSHPDDLVDLRNRGVTYREPLVLLRNLQGKALEDVHQLAGPAFSRKYAARSLAIGDLNNDGYPDIVFTVVQGAPHILLNNANAGNNWLGLELKPKNCNPAAAGAVIRWSISGKVMTRIKTAGGSFLSSSDPREILGAGKQAIDWVEIHWPAPSHTVDRIEHPAMNRYLRIVEGDHSSAPAAPRVSSLHSWRLLRISAQDDTDVATLWREAKAALQRNDFIKARQILLRAVKADPRDPALWFHLGVSCSELKQRDEAIAAFERSRALAPRHSDTYFNLGLLYWHKGDLGKAKEAYQTGLALDPGNAAALQNLSVLLMKTGDYREAIPHLLLLKKDRKLALPARVALIECYLKTQSKAEASEEADELLGLGIASPADQTKLAVLLLQGGVTPAAEKILKHSLEMDPKQANANAVLAAIYVAQKQYKDATGCLNRAMTLDPNSSEYAVAYARTLVFQKQYDALLRFLDSVREKFGQLPDFQYARALAYYRITQFSDAATVLVKLLKQHPPRQDRVDYLLGNSYLALGKYPDAEHAYRDAIEVNPKNTAYYEALATLLRKQGPQRLDEAIAELKRAHQYADTPQIMVQLALCYESKAEYTQAATLMEQAVQRQPELTVAHVALARIYFRLGKKTEAEREKAVVKRLEEQQQAQRIKASSGIEPSIMDEQP